MPTYIFEEEPVTCVSMEKEVGLARGVIGPFNVYSGGAVKIETPPGVVLTLQQQAKLRAMLNAHGLGFGKIPPLP